MISRTLLPCFSWSRIWLRRSTARGALESASVWFWHTRQRSSEAIAVTCCSSAGSSAAGAASPAHAAPASNSSISMARILRTAVQLLDQGQNLFLHDLGCERTDSLVADHTALVDHIGLRHAVDAVVNADLP